MNPIHFFGGYWPSFLPLTFNRYVSHSSLSDAESYQGYRGLYELDISKMRPTPFCRSDTGPRSGPWPVGSQNELPASRIIHDAVQCQSASSI
ncbi:MAG: hypothetical protein METHAR1v1_940002 [Methanothrix sp.]|nr:MAG: hypothetical protein METHAR1v1_940002 [Methanothrix sp.]